MNEHTAGTPGTGQFAGLTWDGHAWRDPAGYVANAKGLASGVPAAAVASDTVATLLKAVGWGILAVLCAVWASSAVPLFGRDLGAVLALAALGLSGIFGLVAFIKMQSR